MKTAKHYAAAFGVWFVFLIIDFVLGAIRELIITPLTGEHVAHIIGTLTVIAAFLGIMPVFDSWSGVCEVGLLFDRRLR